MNSAPCSADIVAVGVVRPGAVPVLKPAPEAIAPGQQWPGYRLEAATEAILFPAERLKRMGRGQALAINAVQRAVDACAVPPEKGTGTAVAMGTAWAEEGDEIGFLQNVIKFGEKGAKPAFFVNSVKNALASQVALNFGFQGENQTYAHDALSFETALWQGARLLAAGRGQHAVVCGVEALVEFMEIHGHLLGHLRTDPAPLTPLTGEPMAGTIPGEGAAAFVLVPVGASPHKIAHLAGVRARASGTRRPVLDSNAEVEFVARAVADFGLTLDQIGLVVVGASGDSALDPIYSAVCEKLWARAPKMATAVYRHLTGDFATASALGLSLAVKSVHERAVAPELKVVSGTPGAPSAALLYHLTIDGYHSAMVVTA